MKDPFFSPLGLEIPVREPKLWVFLVPLVNLLWLGWGMTLVGSAWLSPPGVELHLPKTESVLYTGQKVATVLTLVEGHHILFRRKMYEDTDLPTLFAENFPTHGGLLIKVHKTTEAEFLIRVVEAAGKAGIRNVQLATESL
jgi:biopolymer transport protein ExbD